MITKNTTPRKSMRVPSRRSMTPAKYKALSPEMKRAYTKKANAENAAFDAKIEKRNLEDYKQFAEGLAKLAANARFLEGEIIRSYLEREGKYLVSREFFEQNPRFAWAHAEFEYAKFLAGQQAKKKGNKAREKNVNRIIEGVLSKAKV